MRTGGRPFPTLLLVTLSLTTLPSVAFAETGSVGTPVKVIEAEASYVMGDSDTLAGAEQAALLRAKRKAVEEAGVYIEASSQDIETVSGGNSSHVSSLGVRTISAAVTETETLERRRSLDGDRLVFYIKIRATIHLDKLEEAVKRLHSYEQLAEHHRQLQSENTQLKTQLDQLRKRFDQPDSQQRAAAQALKSRRTGMQLVRMAVESRSLPQKIELASQAIAADELNPDAYVVRGQTFLRVASLAYAKQAKRAEVDGYVERASGDFGQALKLDPTSTWALLGRGDAFTWQRNLDAAAADYERILQLDPLFDTARQRLIDLYTTQAKKQVARRQWKQALATLDKMLHPESPPSWVALEKDAYLLRSQIYTELGDLPRAVEDASAVVSVDPTNGPAYLLRAKLYQRQLQGRLSRSDFERACELGLEEACRELPDNGK
jgi:tetratricopeptide (TPR) repeat protein